MMQRSVFEQYECDSLLARINPAVKMVCSLMVMLFVSVVFDLWTLGAVTLCGTVIVIGPGRVRLRLLLRALLPFVLFGLGFLWMNAVLPRESGTVIASWGPVRVSAEGLLNGAAFFMRALAFGVWSTLFVVSTEPAGFVRSLMHQLRVSPRIAYSALAAYRYLPNLHLELEQIRAAHRLRGMGESRGIHGKFQRAYRYTIPLLAGALRRAARVAAAMEARAFSGTSRSWYKRERLHPRDLLYVLCVLVAMLAIIASGIRSNTLMLWSGRLWD